MATHEIIKYHIPAFWNQEYRHLDYINETFNDPDNLAYWRQLGFSDRFTGDMCDMRKSQPSWNQLIINIFAEMGWQDIGTSYYRMMPGTVLPTHKDLYKKYVNVFNLSGREHLIRRAVIFLEDWSSGHYFEGNGEPYTKWRAGDTVEWCYDTPHLAANLGVAPRYTLQVTGHK